MAHQPCIKYQMNGRVQSKPQTHPKNDPGGKRTMATERMPRKLGMAYHVLRQSTKGRLGKLWSLSKLSYKHSFHR